MRDSKRDTDVLNSLLDSVGEGEGGMIWENGIETCIISYVKRITSPGLMHDAGYMCLFQLWFPRCVCPAVGLLGHKAVLFPVF